jgi:hypothetical protein
MTSKLATPRGHEVMDYVAQGHALWSVQGKSRDKPWEPPRRRRGAQQCSGCGVIFGGVSGFAKHRTGMRCNNPADLGLARADDGVWQRPTPVFRDADGVFGHDRPAPHTAAADSGIEARFPAEKAQHSAATATIGSEAVHG